MGIGRHSLPVINMEQESNTERIGAKVDKTTAETLKGFCEARGENYSGFIRRAVKRELARHSYLSEEEKKALGVKQDG